RTSRRLTPCLIGAPSLRQPTAGGVRAYAKEIGTLFQHIRYGLLEPTNLVVSDRERQRDEPASREVEAAFQHVEVEQIAKQRVHACGIGRRLDGAVDRMRAHQRTDPRKLQLPAPACGIQSVA